MHIARDRIRVQICKDISGLRPGVAVLGSGRLRSISAASSRRPSGS
ncbi:hypothetical protein [Candidatus Thiodictyon syntrophicum]|jgi:hypothetical protein|nr:hypothetical protein [Candidatus Thiodictyon syntrophicum]